MRCVMVYFEHGLGEIALARSLDCAVTADKGHAERSVAGTKVHDGSLFEFQAKGPAAFWRAFPLLESGACSRASQSTNCFQISALGPKAW
jgi:hypothetical protein